MSKFLIFIFLIIFYASPAYSITMDEAVGYALNNNPELQAFRLEAEIAKGNLEKARLLLINNPTIEGELSNQEKPSEEGSGKYKNYGFKLSQEFEISGQRGMRIDIAEKDISIATLAIRDKERELTADVKNAFAKVLALKKKGELSKEAARLQEELLGFAKLKFQAGEASGLDVNFAEIGLSKAKRELISTEREYRETLFALQGILGMKSDLALIIDGELPAKNSLIPDKEGLKQTAFSQRPDFKAVSIEVEKTNSAFSLISKEALPNITLSGFYDREERRNIIGLGLSIPLPFFDRKQAEKKEAYIKTEQAKIKAEGLKKTIERELEQAYSDLISDVEELTLFNKEIMSKATENLGLLNLAFKEGKIGFFEVRLAQKETIEIQFAYIDLQLKTRQAINAMERVIGGDLQ